MHKLFITLLILCNFTPVWAYYPQYNNNFSSKLKMNQPNTTILSNGNYYNHSRMHQNRTYGHPYEYRTYTNNDLNALENYALKKNFRRESDIQRLERLESLAFGTVQTGDLNTRFRNVENAILSGPQNNYKQTFRNVLGNYFAGQPTGFTPSIFGTTYPSNYSNSRLEQYSNGIFGGGWGIQNGNYGGGSSIHILD